MNFIKFTNESDSNKNYSNCNIHLNINNDDWISFYFFIKEKIEDSLFIFLERFWWWWWWWSNYIKYKQFNILNIRLLNNINKDNNHIVQWNITNDKMSHHSWFNQKHVLHE
jgi:hypothetical protein